MSESAANDRSLVTRLEEEGDIAADYLEELLDIADLGGDLEIDVENDRASVEIVASGEEFKDLQRLVGEDGKVLESIQELTRLAVSQKTGEHSRLMLDIVGYRKERREQLSAITEEAITKAKTSGQPVRLEPMNPFERKICHDTAAREGVYSGSQGQAPNRAVVIYPDAQGPTAEAAADN